ncbi:MAG: phage tail protein [Nitrospirales bacterium]|nr:phage tail protein [Nitrospirales bacterium]
MKDSLNETSAGPTRQADERRYGKYRAFVVENKDPDKRGRLQLRIPSVLGDQTTDWALPCFPFGGGAGYGWFAVPEKEAQVWAEFEEGDINRPLWTGCFWQQTNDVPKDAQKETPTTRLLQTPGGHILQFDDEKDKERFRLHHPSKAEMVIDEKGVITLTDASGGKITLDADGKKIIVEDANNNVVTMDSSGTSLEDGNGNKIEMTSSGVTVKGQQVVIEGSQVMLGGQGGDQLIKGMSFMSIFNSHVHTVQSFGPSGPPVPLMTPASLSTKVTTS